MWQAAMNCMHTSSWAQQGDEQSERDILETPGKHTLLIAESASCGSDTWCPAEMLMTFLIFHWHSRSLFKADCLLFFLLLLVWNKYLLLLLLPTCQSCSSACLALLLPGREPPACCSNLVISWFLCLWTGKYLVFPMPPPSPVNFLRTLPFPYKSVAWDASWPIGSRRTLCKWWGEEKIFVTESIAGDRCHLSPEPQVYLTTASWV